MNMNNWIPISLFIYPGLFLARKAEAMI
jgi:hypothetical protein